MSQQDDRLTRIFAAALEFTGARRDEYLDQACEGDANIRNQVRTLLDAFPEAEKYFETSHLKEEVREAATMALEVGPDRCGQLLSHFKLEEFLGAGGMGEVYRATDIALGRPAAIKLLRPGIRSDFRARLLREARTNARLEHPAIATFFESGTAEGVDYLAMEFVEGETLRAHLRHGPLEPGRALALVVPLLEALVHAHGHRIVHRDIKPDNIMVTDQGAPKLLDFGIAKEVGAPGSVPDANTMVLPTALTAHGAIVGTLGYMSPEQLRGSPINERTDVFAMGAVLYEALAGQPAFPGRFPAERMAAVMSDDVPALGLEGVHPDINAIIARAVAKDPEFRYPGAREFLSDLRKYATGEAIAVLPNTVAILDLVNLSGNSEDDWVGSGVAESLGHDLAKAKGFHLVPRTRVIQASSALRKENRVDPLALGMAVGCRWVLTGTYQRMGPSLRLGMRLMEVGTGRDVWSEKLDGTLEGIFEMQDRLAEITASSLDLVLPCEEEAPDHNLDAFELYARAMRLWTKLERGTSEQMFELLERAIECDPGHAPALAQMAWVHAPQRWLNGADPRELEHAADFARRAIDADPDHVEGYTHLGYARWRQGRVAKALELFARAGELKPGDFMPLYFAGCCHSQEGRWAEALACQQRAAQLAPRIPFVMVNVGWNHLQLGNTQAARWTLEAAFETEKSQETFHWSGNGTMLADFWRREGDFDRARTVCMESLELIEQGDFMARSGSRACALMVLGRAAQEQGDEDAARVALNQSLELILAQDKAIGMGHNLVQAKAALSRLMGNPVLLDEAENEFKERRHFDFSWGLLACDSESLLEMATSARVLGRTEAADRLLKQARRAGAA